MSVGEQKANTFLCILPSPDPSMYPTNSILRDDLQAYRSTPSTIFRPSSQNAHLDNSCLGSPERKASPETTPNETKTSTNF